jgi:hypothetical protein
MNVTVHGFGYTIEYDIDRLAECCSYYKSVKDGHVIKPEYSHSGPFYVLLFESIVNGEINNFNVEMYEKEKPHIYGEREDIIYEILRIAYCYGTNEDIMEKLVKYASLETLKKYLHKIEKIKNVEKNHCEHCKNGREKLCIKYCSTCGLGACSYVACKCKTHA